MKNLSYSLFKDFILSDYNEAEFFNINKGNLITLKEYLELLNNENKQLKKEIQPNLALIKEKYNWIKNIEYLPKLASPFNENTLHISGEDWPDILMTKINNEVIISFQNGLLFIPEKKIKFYIFKKYQSRKKDLLDIQNELVNILETGKSNIKYPSLLSASEYFKANYMNDYVSINCNQENLMNIYLDSLKINVGFFSEIKLFSQKFILTKTECDNLSKKLIFKKQ